MDCRQASHVISYKFKKINQGLSFDVHTWKLFTKLCLTVSAAVRLIPSPPALVLSRNTKMSERVWKSATMSRLSEILDEPSSLMQVCFLCHMYSLKGNNITCFISQYKHNMILLFLQKALLAIICPNKDFLGCQKEIWKLFFIF